MHSDDANKLEEMSEAELRASALFPGNVKAVEAELARRASSPSSRIALAGRGAVDRDDSEVANQLDQMSEAELGASMLFPGNVAAVQEELARRAFAKLGEEVSGHPGERRLFVRAASEAAARAQIASAHPDLEITYAGFHKDGCFDVCVRRRG